MSQEEFSSLSLDERIATVGDRLGNQPDRITHPKELLSLRGEEIFIVISPFGDSGNEQIGNGTLLSIKVGDVKKHTGEQITEDSEISIDNDEKYLCFCYDNNESCISLRDFNIIPNSYNNHAVFTSEEAATAYMIYRKLQWEVDNNIMELEGDYTVFVTNDDINLLLDVEAKTKSETEAEGTE